MRFTGLYARWPRRALGASVFDRRFGGPHWLASLTRTWRSTSQDSRMANYAFFACDVYSAITTAGEEMRAAWCKDLSSGFEDALPSSLRSPAKPQALSRTRP